MSSSIKYRPEIDGIRAIAVLAVIIFHMRASWLPGGYTGVDVFFVLSGFLITSILAKEVATGTFSFKSFYVRRIKRILPPLYVVLLATLTFSFFALAPKDISHLSNSIKSILLFMSNVFFYKDGDYFAPETSEMPLLHTWSLAVEEQFYFVWPFIFLMLSRIRRHFRLIILIGLALLTFAIGEYSLTVLNNKPYAYYSSFSRGGEMILGAILALLIPEQFWAKQKNIRPQQYAWGIVGSLFLLTSFFLLKEGVKFPGFNALLPTLGTVVLIWSMAGPQTLFSRILSSPLFVHVGKLSYSLYLWHWPILAFMRYLYGSLELPNQWLVAALTMTYCLSLASFHLIENKVRIQQLTFGKAAVLYFLLPSAVIAISLQMPKFTSPVAHENKMLTHYGGEEICHDKITDNCVRGNVLKKPQILVLGDSHTAHLNYFFDELGKLNDWSAQVVSSSSCGPVFDFNTNKLPESARANCLNLLNYFQKNYTHFDVIILAARWEFQLGLKRNPQSDPLFEKKFINTLSEISKNRKKVFIISQIPLLSTDPVKTQKARMFGLSSPLTFDDDFRHANMTIKAIIEEHPNVHWVDIASLVESLKGSPEVFSIYIDKNHLNQAGARTLGQLYQKTKNEIQP